MRRHEGRSFAPPPPPPCRQSPGRTGRRGWTRPDVARPVAPARVPLPSPNPIAAEIEEPEEADTVDVFGLLPVEARWDVLAGSVAAVAGIRNAPVLVERQSNPGLCHACDQPLDDARPVVAVMQAKGGGHLWMHGGECHDAHRRHRAALVDDIMKSAGYGAETTEDAA